MGSRGRLSCPKQNSTEVSPTQRSRVSSEVVQADFVDKSARREAPPFGSILAFFPRGKPSPRNMKLAKPPGVSEGAVTTPWRMRRPSPPSRRGTAVVAATSGCGDGHVLSGIESSSMTTGRRPPALAHTIDPADIDHLSRPPLETFRREDFAFAQWVTTRSETLRVLCSPTRTEM